MLNVAALLFAVYCAAGSQDPMPFKMIDGGAQSFLDDRREVVVRTAAEWAAFWKTHAPTRPRPAVDFSRSMIVGIFVGVRPTGGHAVEITGIEREGADLVVSYRERRPDKADVVTQILTMPYALVTTARFTGPVRFTALQSK